MISNRTDLFHAHESERLLALDGVPLAAFRSRAAAFVIDLMLILVVYLAINLPSALADRARNPAHPLLVHFDPFHGLWGVVALVLYFGILTYIGNGRTPGKRLLGIRVVSAAHDRLSFWQCVERALGYGASALEGGFGFVQYFIHPNHRTVHDRIAETIVVKEIRLDRAR